jgi:hypothetical protein
MEEERKDELINPIGNDLEISTTNELAEGYSLKRITFGSLLSFVLSVLNFEKGILFSIKELILRPRIVIEEYLKKDRKKLVNPIRFLVFSSALSAFLSLILINKDPAYNTMQADFQSGFNEGVEKTKQNDIDKTTDTISFNSNSITAHVDSVKYKRKELRDKKMKEFGNQIQEITKKYSDKFIFIIVLFFSFFTFLFFRKSGYNLTENLVINAFMSSISNVFSIITTILALITGELYFMIAGTVLSVVYSIYYWVNVYNRKSVGGVFRSILVYLTSYFTFTLIVGIIVVVYILIILVSIKN